MHRAGFPEFTKVLGSQVASDRAMPLRDGGRNRVLRLLDQSRESSLLKQSGLGPILSVPIVCDSTFVAHAGQATWTTSSGFGLQFMPKTVRSGL